LKIVGTTDSIQTRIPSVNLSTFFFTRLTFKPSLVLSFPKKEKKTGIHGNKKFLPLTNLHGNPEYIYLTPLRLLKET
jgi:hypothetical protein